MFDEACRRIFVLFPGALGDFICFLPALRILSDDAPVDLFAQSAFADLVPPTVRVYSLERYEIRRLFVPGAADDESVCRFYASYASIYSWMGSQPCEFVRQMNCVSGGRARVFPFRASAGKMHQTDYYLSCIDRLHHARRIPTVGLQPEALRWCESYWTQQSLLGKAVLVLAPGSGAREKNWPATSYRVILDWWRQRTEGAAVVLLGPVEQERGGLELLLNRAVVARSLTLAQAAALLARSDLYLGNDSGISHLAAAVGVPTVALFGPTDARQWAPRGEVVRILRRNAECSPCDMPVMKRCSHRKCLTSFHPTDVITELEKLAAMATLTRGGAGVKVSFTIFPRKF